MLVALSALTVTVDTPAERPNVVLILVDDMGYDDLGMAGNPIVRTPHLDALAARGVQWTEFYVSPVCGLTRAALMSGRYPHHAGVPSNGMPMRSSVTTIAEHLRDAGYATGIFGKWHLGDHFPSRPIDQGFEQSLVARGGIIGQLADTPPLGRYTDPILSHNGTRELQSGYATDVYFETALDWMEDAKKGERPFFAYISTNAPHRPYIDPPLPEYERYLAEALAKAGDSVTPANAERLDENSRVYAMIERIDTNVGRLFTRLEAMDALGNTLVIFLSDNGPTSGRFSTGLRGGKASVLEGGIKTRFFAQWPNGFSQGVRSGRPAAHVDILPTLLDACGVEPPEDWITDGRSLLPTFRDDGAAWPERSLFFEAHRGVADPRMNYAVRTSRWKLVRNGGYRTVSAKAKPRLFDMRVDPLETTDVAGAHADVVDALIAEFETIADQIETEAERVTPRIQLGNPKEVPLFLSRSQWGRARESDDNAVWDIQVIKPGRYDIRVYFEPSDEEREVTIWIAGSRRTSKTRKMDVPKGAGSCVFKRVGLEKGAIGFSGNIGRPSRTGAPIWMAEISGR